jgi:hypothetical protein
MQCSDVRPPPLALRGAGAVLDTDTGMTGRVAEDFEAEDDTIMDNVLTGAGG